MIVSGFLHRSVRSESGDVWLISRAGRLLFLSLLLCCIGSTVAGEIKYKGVELYQSEDKIMMDLVETYQLNETVLEALESGVPLAFETQINLRRDGAFFWQGDVVNRRLQSVLRFHPLASEYEVHKIYKNQRLVFATLNAALEALGLMRSLDIIEVAKLNTDEYYMVDVRTYLDIGALPLPLRPLAYLSPKWHLQSKVWEWRLKP